MYIFDVQYEIYRQLSLGSKIFRLEAGHFAIYSHRQFLDIGFSSSFDWEVVVKSANGMQYNRLDTLYVQHTRLLLYPSTSGAPPPVRSSFKYVPAICAKQSSLPRTIQPEQLALNIIAGVCTTQPHIAAPSSPVRPSFGWSRSHPALVSY